MFLLVGLGNPGLKYQHTRHNFGFLLADQIINDYQFSPATSKLSKQVFSGKIADKKIILLKPQDYMNNSGLAVEQVINFYKIPLTNLIVFHDDLDLDLGRIKVKIGGGNAGHNGLKDIDDKVGKDYRRIRLGIGRPLNPDYEIADYVLSKFSGDDLQIVEDINKRISNFLPIILNGQADEFMNQFSLTKKPSPSL